MGYQLALEKAGANVLDFQEFGSYQGTWLAFVEYNGEKGIVECSYGSCSGCDAFQAEFDYCDTPEISDGKFYKSGRTWDEEDECNEDEYKKALENYDQRLIEFGKQYLEPLYDKAHYELMLSKLETDDWFDSETKEYCEWAITRFVS